MFTTTLLALALSASPSETNEKILEALQTIVTKLDKIEKEQKKQRKEIDAIISHINTAQKRIPTDRLGEHHREKVRRMREMSSGIAERQSRNADLRHQQMIDQQSIDAENRRIDAEHRQARAAERQAQAAEEIARRGYVVDPDYHDNRTGK